MLIADCAFAGNQMRMECDRADAVVVGTLSQLQPPQPGVSPTPLKLAVDGVIKGEMRAPLTITVHWAGAWRNVTTFTPYRAVWFLRRSDRGFREISPIDGPRYGPQGLMVLPSARVDGPVRDPGCYQAVWELMKQNAPHIDESYGYFRALEIMFRDMPDTMAAALPDFQTTIQEYLRSPSINLRALAMGRAILQQDVKALEQLASEVGTIGKPLVAPQVSNALMSWTNPDPAALKPLMTIVKSPEAGTWSRHAAGALMQIHTKEAVPYLVGLLTHSDLYMQEMGVTGLSMFVKAAPLLTLELRRAYRADFEHPDPEYLDLAISPYVSIQPVPVEQLPEYVAAWQAWWSRMSGKWNCGTGPAACPPLP